MVRMSGRKFGIFTILLVSIILFCMKDTAVSIGNGRRAEENYYYQVLERQYVAATRKFLNEQGFDDCGVMVTRVTNGSGRREYTVRLHHRRLQRLGPEAKRTLEDRLSQAEFEGDSCTFHYEL